MFHISWENCLSLLSVVLAVHLKKDTPRVEEIFLYSLFTENFLSRIVLNFVKSTFSASSIQSCDFSSWWIALIPLLNQPWLPGIHLTWPWFKFLFICWALFTRVLLGIYVSIFIRNIGLLFSCDACLVSSSIILGSLNELFPFLFSGIDCIELVLFIC